MKIFSGSQYRAWDAYSMSKQGIRSIELMERAAGAVFAWLQKNYDGYPCFYIFCGKGNNGGDGLALARMLLVAGKNIQVFVLETGSQGSPDFIENLRKLHNLNAAIVFCQNPQSFPNIPPDCILVDALFGTGLNKPPEGLALQLVNHLQQHQGIKIAIDMPSGLFTDRPSNPNHVLPATHTLSFQGYKLSQLINENGPLLGEVLLLDIGLSANFEKDTEAAYETIDDDLIKMIIKPRNPYGHKGSFGNAAIIAGKQGMMGAAILASRGCLASGVGKTTLMAPESQLFIPQIAVPEVICEPSGKNIFENKPELQRFRAIGIGPGIGTADITRDALLKTLLEIKQPVLLDADALNCLQPSYFQTTSIQHGIITPHPGEFDRLFGTSENGFTRFEKALHKSAETGWYIVLKGHHTCIFTPKGKVFINTNGNDGMAKGGSGDLLTGFITGLMAQGYPLPEAAIIGVYLHGLSGNMAAEKFSRHSMQPSQMAECFGDAWKKFE